MKEIPRWLKTAAVVAVWGYTSTALATTGYFSLGYGAKSMGLAGAVVSNPQDSLAAATNPAGMALVGERADFGLHFFSPQREAELGTSVLGAGAAFTTPYDVEDRSRRDLFLIPGLGFTKKINDKVWWGISMYGNGGMNSTYDRNLYDETAAVLGAIASGIPNPTPPPVLLCDPAAPPPGGCGTLVPEGSRTGTPNTGTLGVDIAQVLIVPTISVRVRDKHTFGISLLIGIQRFSARGLGNFQCFTRTAATNPANIASGACAPGGFGPLTPGFVPSKGLTNNGNDWSYGAGVRVGWIGEVHSRLTLGLAAASKVYMTELDDYDELFAEDGDFDIPANVTAGLTFKATPKLSFIFDFQEIFFEGVNSLSNAGPVPTAFGPGLPPGGGLLGASNGIGFGWENTSIYRLATEYRYSSKWIYRAGLSWNDQPIPDNQVLFNILAPAIVQTHATVGFTFMPDDYSEWSFAYMHAFEEKVRDPLTAFGVPAEISMYQDSVDLGYSLKF